MFSGKIESFFDENTRLYFYGSSVYISESNAALFNGNGYMLLADSTLISSLYQKKIPLPLIRPFKSRKFAGDQEFILRNCDCDIHPEFFMVDLTNRCNMRCKYCLRNVSSSDRTICKERLKSICKYIEDYCNETNLKHVSIQPWGGEPLLELDLIIKMREWIQPIKTKVHFTIETNGTLLSPEIVDILYKNKIGLGISIDGIKETHDQQRLFASGLESHEIVVKNLIEAKKRYGERLGIITTITKNNADHIEKILDYYAKELKLSKVKFNFVHKSTFVECDELCLSKEEISNTEIRILHKITSLHKEGFPITEYNINVKLNNLLFLKYSDICLSRGCGGGRKMIVFDIEGRIYPCELTDIESENIGSISDEHGLIKLVEDAMHYRSYFIPKKADACQNCDWYIFCKGGCTVRTISLDKQPPAIDEIECAVNSALYPELIRLILEEPDTVNMLLENQSVV